jgi:hypothetical protein
MNKKKNNKRTAILAATLIGLLIIGYKVVMPSEASLPAEDNIAASQRVESVLKEVENINFDMSIMEDEKFQSLRSIEMPLAPLPVGRANPFSAI